MIRISVLGNDSIYPPSCSCIYYGLMQTEDKLCHILKKPYTANMNSLISIIENKVSIRYKGYGCKCDALRQSSSLSDIRPIPSYEKWKSRINIEFKTIIENSLASFADKLEKIDCGSFEEKKFFLSGISGEIAVNHPFKMINNSMISFMDDVIAKIIRHNVAKEIEDITNDTNRDYGKLKEIIIKKSEEAIRKEDNRMNLISLISNKIIEFHKKKYTEEELMLQFNINKFPFNIFTDLYRDHLSENYGLIISNSIGILDNLGQDMECCLSFIFNTFFGKMLMFDKANELCDVMRRTTYDVITSDLMSFLRTSVSSRNTSYSMSSAARGYHVHFYSNTTNEGYREDFEEFIIRSKKKLEIKIIECLKGNTIVIEENKVALCSKKFMKEIVHSSTKHLEEEIRSSFY
ncbi:MULTISPECIES: hypothetical protein [Candidatus Ichthyocystis]|nr:MULTISPECIES: hypothetical protein [Ichthyocystis]